MGGGANVPKAMGSNEKEDSVGSIAQPVPKGTGLLKPGFSPAWVQLKNERLQDVQRSLTLSCPYLWCWLSYQEQTDTLVGQCQKAYFWIQRVSLWTKSQHKVGENHTINLEQATPCGQIQLVATTRNASDREEKASGMQLSVFSPGGTHVLTALWLLGVKGKSTPSLKLQGEV